MTCSIDWLCVLEAGEHEIEAEKAIFTLISQAAASSRLDCTRVNVGIGA